MRSGGFHRRHSERVVHPELCPPHHTHRRYAVRLGAGSGARTPDAGLRGQRAEGISAHYTGKQFIPGGLAAPRGFPPDLSDQQEWSAEWGHFGGGIGTGQAEIKTPRTLLSGQCTGSFLYLYSFFTPHRIYFLAAVHGFTMQVFTLFSLRAGNGSPPGGEKPWQTPGRRSPPERYQQYAGSQLPGVRRSLLPA